MTSSVKTGNRTCSPPASEELFDSAYREEIRKHLAEAITGLAEKEQLVLSLYYYEELTMKEIGATLGYTESRISQIHTKAMLKLKTRLSRKLRADDLPESIQGERRPPQPKSAHPQHAFMMK